MCAKPYVHSKSSVKRHKGCVDDYLKIHEIMDSSKSITALNSHRVMTHNSWFISTIIPLIFGENITNSDGKVISSRQIAEEHVLEDFGMRFIPSGQDFLEHLEFKSWFNNGVGPDVPSSFKKIEDKKTKRTLNLSSFTESDKKILIIKKEMPGVLYD